MSMPRVVWIAIALATTHIQAAKAQTPVDREVASKWASIVEWIGFWEATETRTHDYRCKLNSDLWSRSLDDAQTSSRFRLRRTSAETSVSWDAAHGHFDWKGTGTETWVSTATSAAEEGSTGHDIRTTGSGSVASREVSFTVNLEDGLASFGPGANVAWPDGQTIGWTRAKLETTQVKRQTSLLRAVPCLYKGEQKAGWWTFAEPLGAVVFDDRKVWTKQDGDSTYGYDYRGHVVLCPVYDDLECEVTIPGYVDWMPKGSISDPGRPGNALLVHAVLKSRNGKREDIPKVDRFRVRLLDTSREPGICLNWPLGARDDDYDLRLADLAAGAGLPDPQTVKRFLFEWRMQSAGDYTPDTLPPGGVPPVAFAAVSDNGQKGELVDPPKDKDGRPYIDIAIESYDFGAKTELLVVCQLEDGREIVGLMKTPGGEQDIVRLPRRNGPDWVAAKWRELNGATDLTAGDDDERVAGQPLNGDGFTLYEEYRGWVERGRHITGDPKAKDYFVLNLAGGDGVPGIGLFAALSQLRVHSLLRPSEMSETERTMNGNHRDAPQRVLQHGVWVKTLTDDPPGTPDGKTGQQKLGDTGAATVMLRSGVVGRPGITKGIALLARDDTASLFKQPFNLPAQDAVRAFDRAIAHELLHSVGVDHHGSGDSFLGAVWVSPRHPRNRFGGPHFRPWGGWNYQPMTLLDESGHDIATQLMTQYAAARQNSETVWGDRCHRESAAYANYFDDNGNRIYRSQEEMYQSLIEDLVSQDLFEDTSTLGSQHGPHSGAQDCVMRYYFAKFYEALGRPQTFYRVTPGTDHIGLEICHSSLGTGINAPNPPGLPQSRFGDATIGDCFAQICPNDAIPPRASR
ncbi:MAG: hypothetical protein U1E73_11970 [Planctomycetota bacterium]